MSRRQFLLLIVPLLAVLLGFVAIGYWEERGAGGAPWDEALERALRATMVREFVGWDGDADRGWAAFFAAQDAYLRHFDPNQTVVPPWRVKEAAEDASGRKVAIGVLTKPILDAAKAVVGLEVVGVQPKGPADGAGIRVGDAIVAVDGTTVAEIGRDLSLDAAVEAAVERIRGGAATAVRLRLRDPAGAEREVSVVRAEIAQGSVFGARLLDAEHGIGYLRIANFHEDTGRDFRARLADLKRRGARELVLDLRGNRGGMLDQAVSVASAFLDRGVIVRVRSRHGTEVHEAKPDDTDARGMPLAVLVDRDSASSSEVVAGALQDHRRGVLVGEPTFGKFTVQAMRKLPSRKGDVFVKVTTAIYETPAGHVYPRASPHGEDALAGLRPDLLVPIPARERDLLYASDGVFEEQRFAEWKPAAAAAHADFVDRQLAAALALLRGETVYPELVRES
jgi:C-terminal peptidase prc